jgi:dolichol-phosphate mannosyltransferase
MEFKVTIIIPTKNEESTIEGVIGQAKPYSHDLLVIDGCSVDNTVKIAERNGARVISDNGRGKGDGIKTGIIHAAGDIIVFMDADGSHNALDIPRLIEPIIKDKADLVIASRILGGSDEFSGTLDNIIRMMGSLIVSHIIAKRWNIVLTDCNNGFRAIKRTVALDLGLKRNDFVIEQEMVINCAKKGYRVMEISSHEYQRKAGKSKLETSQGWKFILHFLKEIIKSFLPL